MPDIASGDMTFGERIGRRFGPDARKLFDQMVSDAEIGPHIRILSPERVMDGVKAALDLASYLEAKQDEGALSAALRGVFAGITGRLPLRAISPAAVPARPTTDGLVEGLTGLCDAKESLPQKMLNADFDLPALRSATVRIIVLRAAAAATMRFAGSVLRNLAVLEDGSVKVLRECYGMVRSAAQADSALWEFLEPTETYLFGAAQQGADTRARMDAARKDAFAAGKEEAQHAAERKVRDSLADEIISLSEDLRRSATGRGPGEPR